MLQYPEAASSTIGLKIWSYRVMIKLSRGMILSIGISTLGRLQLEEGKNLTLEMISREMANWGSLLSYL